MAKTVAIIPARGNSKEVINKNLRFVGDKTLLERAIESAYGIVDLVIVTTESRDISQIAGKYYDRGVVVYERPYVLCADNVQVDEVVLFTLRQFQEMGGYSFHEYDTVVVLQPTSPFRTAQHVSEAVNFYQDLETNRQLDQEPFSVMSVYNTGKYHYIYNWHKMYPLEHDPLFRRGRQYVEDGPEVVVENGAIYVASIEDVFRYRTFRTPNIIPYYMREWESLEIDTEVDLKLANLIAEYSTDD